MQVQCVALPRMIDDGEWVLAVDDVLHPQIHEPRDRDDRGGRVEAPAFPAFHRPPCFSRTASMASTRRTAFVVARAVSVAPAIGRIARFTARSSSSSRPRNCRSHASGAWYSGGS